MYSRLKNRKQALEMLKRIKDDAVIIHYSCESFYDIKDGRTPRITSIAIRYIKTRQTNSFSIHKVAEIKNIKVEEIDKHYDELEKIMLDDFFKFVKKQNSYYWIHWNMRDINYGFQALEHRFAVLKGKATVVEDDRKYDLGSKIIDIYSNELIDHPRLPKLIEYNKMTSKDLLSGKDEALAFENKEFVKLHQSTLRKVDIIQNIVEKIVDGTLKTKAKWHQIYGVTPQGIHELIGDNWIASLTYSILMIIIGGMITKSLHL